VCPFIGKKPYVLRETFYENVSGRLLPPTIYSNPTVLIIFCPKIKIVLDGFFFQSWP
jgi:hypothetical protein